MGLTNAQYDILIRNYEKTRDHNRHLLQERKDFIYTHVAGYRELEDSIGSLSVDYGKKYLNGEEQALEELKLLLKELSAKKEELLTLAGIPADYLETIYQCPDCKDTGYIDNQKCHCFRHAMITLLYEQSGIQEMLRTDNFSVLSYEYHQGDDLLRFQNTVKACQSFIKNFQKDYQNLFFYGTVGTGKSFLSGCIAQALIESGYSVIYFSASGLFELLSRHAFDAKNKENLQKLYGDLHGCDLLMIDDLGTELTNHFVASELFSCLNERHMAKKSTVISTNLSLEDLQNRYSDRIFSRISSHYQLYKLTGPDIRMARKRAQKLAF